MCLKDLLNKLLSLLQEGDNNNAYKTFFIKNRKIWLSYADDRIFEEIIDDIYKNKKLNIMFSRKTIYRLIKDLVLEYKITDKVFDSDINMFFEKISKREISPFNYKLKKEINPYNGFIAVPISGITLKNNFEIEIGNFKIGLAQLIKSMPIDKCKYYIGVKIKNIYDNSFAVEKAENMFLDFVRLITFLDGNFYGDVHIKIGLPVYEDYGQDKIHIKTYSYVILNEQNEPEKQLAVYGDIYDTAHKIVIDEDFFCNNPDFNKLWDLYASDTLNEIEQRIINAALCIGESLSSQDIKSSIIYTCMALETLFSFDEAGLFQKSIADKISDIAVFLVCKNKEHRLKTKKAIKKFYGLRSTLVHGGSRETNDSYKEFNNMIKAAIRVLLNDERFSNIKTIKELYELVEDAQKSY